MNDILSQAEIDELMKVLTSGESDEAQEQPEDNVKVYDFRTANRFTKDVIRAISVIYRNFGHLLSNYLMGTLRRTDAEILSIEKAVFQRVQQLRSIPVIIGIVNVTPLQRLHNNGDEQEISYSIISRVLGAQGKSLRKAAVYRN